MRTASLGLKDWAHAIQSLLGRHAFPTRSSQTDRFTTAEDRQDPPDESRLRQLMSLALTTPTVEAVLEFSAFASRLKRLGPYNVYMVYAQRPGALAIASRAEWQAAGQTVRADAIPILVLRPKGPITQVFELSDTLPQLTKDPREHPFAAVGPFDPEQLQKLIAVLAKPSKRLLKVDVMLADFGAELAGQIVQQPLFADGGKLLGRPGMTAFEGGCHRWEWRIKINRRLTAAEQFATLYQPALIMTHGPIGGVRWS